MRKFWLLSAFLNIAFTGWSQTDAYTTNKGILEIHPVYHGSFWMQWNNLRIAVDPYGGIERYKEMAKADLILITDIHGDHMDSSTLVQLNLENTFILAPAAVAEKLAGFLPAEQKIKVLANGDSTQWRDIVIQAIPMYNLPDTATSRHPKGRGNGYVITLGGKRVYVSGDTEDIPEMRALQAIDIAFICMNKPYTMDIYQAANAVLAFKPAVVYPFHFRQPEGLSDVQEFSRIVKDANPSIDVRLRKWY